MAIRPSGRGAVACAAPAGGRRLAARRACVLLACLASLCACGDGGGETARFGTRDYSFASGGKVKVPGSFPGDVALYEGARLVMAQRFDVSDATLVLATKDAPGVVEGFYREQCEKSGWRLVRESSLDGQRYLGFRKPGRALTVIVTPEGESTLVSVVYKSKS